jgi:hypothetical protein
VEGTWFVLDAPSLVQQSPYFKLQLAGLSDPVIDETVAYLYAKFL